MAIFNKIQVMPLRLNYTAWDSKMSISSTEM